MKPIISVIIPVYGVEKYIERCLMSLFTNTIADKCEFIIVNDCSPDKSIELAYNIIKKFNTLNIRIIDHKLNKGLAAARNTGLLNSLGKYIINVDSDDWVENDYLELLFNTAEENSADIVGCNLIQEFNTFSKKQKMILPSESSVAVADLLKGKILGYTVLKLVKKTLFEENNIEWVEGLNMCEDLLITLKLFTVAKKIIYLDKYLYHYECSNPNSLSYSLNESKIKQLLLVPENIYSFLTTKGLGDRYKSELLTLKSRFKIWIIKCAEKNRYNYLNLYEEDKLFMDSNSSFLIRVFFFFCDIHFYTIAKFIVFIKLLLEK